MSTTSTNTPFKKKKLQNMEWEVFNSQNPKSGKKRKAYLLKWASIACYLSLFPPFIITLYKFLAQKKNSEIWYLFFSNIFSFFTTVYISHILYMLLKIIYFWVVCVFWRRNACHLLLLSSQSLHTTLSLKGQSFSLRERKRATSSSHLCFALY